MKKRILSILICICMLCSILSTIVMAADNEVTITIGTDGRPTETSGTGWNYNGSTLTLRNGYNFIFTENTCTVAITNQGKIIDGTFNSTVTNSNKGRISGGAFYGTVKNNGGTSSNRAYIDDGTFYGEVININPSYIRGGNFNGPVSIPFGAYITGGTFYGEIKSYLNTSSGAYTSGQISGGTFYGNMDSFLSGGWASIKGGTFAINYELDGGEWIDEENILKTYTYSDKSSISLPTEQDIYKYGYTFMGWYESKDFTGAPIKAIAKKTGGVKTFYAYFAEGSVTQPIYNWEIAGNTAVEGMDYTVDVNGNYTVYTALGLAKVANIVNDGESLSGKIVTLANDIDLYKGGVYGYEEGGKITNTNSWIPIDGFAGTFDGNGKKIENLYINQNTADSVRLGLFGSNTGTIKKLILKSGKIRLNIGYLTEYTTPLKSYYVGSIAASASGVIDNCQNYIDVEVTSDNDAFQECDVYMGGIVATSINGAIVSNCTNYAKIYSYIYASASVRGGGIVGSSKTTIVNNTNLIDNCYNEGTVDFRTGSHSYAGGIAGYVQPSARDDIKAMICNSGNVGTIGGTYVGGIAGFCDNKVAIVNNYNLGNIKTDSTSSIGLYAGGIVGYGDRYNELICLEIINCYNAGTISGAQTNGSIAGRLNDGYITSSYFLSSSQNDIVGMHGGTNTINNTFAFTKSEDRYTFVDANNSKIELLNALNSWVYANIGNGYLNWVADEKNENYPVLGSIEYLITFDVGEGSLPDGTANPVGTTNGKLLSLPEPTREGYIFEGWFDGENKVSKDTVYKDNTTLKAKWVAVYNVILNTNGGTIVDGKNVTSYIFGVGATLPTADEITYSGYTFGGWYDNSDFTGDAVTEITATDENDKVFWAKWTKIDDSDASIDQDTDKDENDDNNTNNDSDQDTDSDQNNDSSNEDTDSDQNNDSSNQDTENNQNNDKDNDDMNEGGVNSPQTGDNILLFVGVLGISVLGILITIKFEKNLKK